MSTNYHTPIVNNSSNDAATTNGPLGQLDQAISDIVDGTTTLAAKILDFTNAQHDHEDAAGGGQLTADAIDSSGASDGDVLTADGAGGAAFEAAQLIPTGSCIEFGGAVLPTGFLWADGSAVSRSTYAALYAVLGDSHRQYGTINAGTITLVGGFFGLTTSETVDVYWAAGSRTGCDIDAVYASAIDVSGGSGDALPTGGTAVSIVVASNKFFIQDRRGSFGLGADNMGGVSANRVTAAEADNVGQRGGAETHTLTVSEIPPHNHIVGESAIGNIQAVDAGAGGTDTFATGAAGLVAFQDTGGGSAHNNMQPYQTCNYIVKT
jgi:microcystin-dependent protein